MRILITGASGLVGGKLIPVLKSKGHEIYKLSRSKAENPNEIQWDAFSGFSDEEQAKLEGIEAVVHLAGDNVAGGSWTDEKKRSIRQSRVVGTRTLVNAFRRTVKPPKVFVSASAIGFYGNRGDEILTEESAKGDGFFPEVCSEWEAEAFKAKEFSARVVCPRIGVVLSKDGGALEKMLTPFKFGVGGTVGSGEQFMSWIAIDDLIRIIVFAIENDQINGAINAAAPKPVTNEEFTNALGKALNRPTIIPVPAFGIKLLFGEMGKTLLLEGCRVLPRKLEDFGFEFEFPTLESALENILKD
jgi:uncharacterized protein (TIGR01777 family)